MLGMLRAARRWARLGARCNRASWPHKTLHLAAGNLYGFRSDYPGLGHAGNPKAVLRDLDDRELIGVSCMLLGILPYVDPSLDLNQVYGEFAATSNVVEVREPSAAEMSSPLLRRIEMWFAHLLGKQ
jgi:hypothetical protein